MVNKYKRKPDRQSWNSEYMRLAITAVETNEMDWLRGSKEFNDPRGTLGLRASHYTVRNCMSPFVILVSLQPQTLIRMLNIM